ncbi:conserved Plasmodium protein, unknown function [Plasmodium knowlesi strain H]|uniref:Uncharacterized protein n=3 Tax=Plasmodium knowlesi TaxID=5850 RepID=A0A5K1ULC7_PLAKH|nr:conserved Plasmodium protein, unknown function [Plasmodium knowlesi strain H]OTN63979.1 Uncharacterized protein PKNOH_S140246800 [Plasmodium knowlesi]CAA9990887.1 conserved Plasmodium protein, unknown function [Plasmodium knowlesi strain H]SBO20889.1 conserved Plasmodium protein, unknown function [Plasmodium knowlesi strain H]SBO21350.1 conserved Plasmodium protein, unknown function [Plasmodium knowlesi strain H]VVS80361.1 conserved Plasmodium protein, unknown function [Plasmodium knowlesi |eukprot:XP_002262173.1 hypothetical protein, conserved in Plasmodium species [Plasmodium knowlesi strain H]
MKKKQFFQIVESNDLSAQPENSPLDLSTLSENSSVHLSARPEKSSLNLSANSIVDFNKLEKKKKNNLSETQLSHNSHDIFNNVSKRNALNFLGLCNKKKNVDNFQGENESEKGTHHAHVKSVNHEVLHTPGINTQGVKCENGDFIIPNGVSPCTVEFPPKDESDNSRNSARDEHGPSTPFSRGEDARENQRNNHFYCLRQIIHNNLNNNYDKSEVKIFNIYHDSRAECLFNDASVIKFYGHENVCIYENKSYICEEINANLFHQNEEKEKEKENSFDAHTDIYEYLYKEKIKLSSTNGKDKGNCDQNGIMNECGHHHEQVKQCFQFYMHKYPSFLKGKIKIFIHLYNIFSIYPYINHKFIEQEIYSKNLKISSSFEKIVHIKWRFYAEHELREMLNRALLNKKREHSLQESCLHVDDYIDVNFLTQQVKVRDVGFPHDGDHGNNNSNYILLNGNGLCFSAYYHLIVPYHRHINQSAKEIDKRNSDYNLSYEYVYLSQLFNIYDNFHVCFLYPLFVSYFFYYHLFFKGDRCASEVDPPPSLPPEATLAPSEKKGTQEGAYKSTCEEVYTNQIDDIYAKLTNCVKESISNTQCGSFKIKDGVIEFLVPQSCYKNCEEPEFLADKSHHLPLLYVVCISKHGVSNRVGDVNYGLHHSVWNSNMARTSVERNMITFPANSTSVSSCHVHGHTHPVHTRESYSTEEGLHKTNPDKEQWTWELHDNNICRNEVKEFNNLRTIFPEGMKHYFNTCNKIDNIIKVSVRNDGVCFMYVRNILGEYIFFSYFILFNAFENLVHLMNKGKNGRTHREGHWEGLHQNGETAGDNTTSVDILHMEPIQQCGEFYSNVLDSTRGWYRPNLGRHESEEVSFANIENTFEMSNISNIYNDFYICENKRMNTFKLFNIMNREKKKILTAYYFENSKLTPIFFLRLSNIHIYDINRQLNSVFEYINYNNKTFTPFLEKYAKYEMNVQLDLLENMYNINNELYLLYTKKINYSHDIYKYNYLYVQDYLLKNYILYYNIYFRVSEEMKKNAYFKLKYTNRNKQTISVHFTVSFNYAYDRVNSHFGLTPSHYITHLESDSPHEQVDSANYIVFISKYVHNKYVK